MSLTDLLDLWRHAAAPVRQEGTDEPQERHEDAEYEVALRKVMRPTVKMKTGYRTARMVPQNHCMPDMSRLPFVPPGAREAWAGPPEDTPCTRVRLIREGDWPVRSPCRDEAWSPRRRRRLVRERAVLTQR